MIIPVGCSSSDKRLEPAYDGSWESLQKMPIPAWFDDGKIGIFIHWGPYSVIGYREGDRGYAEHVPKLLYADSESYYPYLKERWGAIQKNDVGIDIWKHELNAMKPHPKFRQSN